MKCGNGVKRTGCPRQTLMAVAVASVLWMLAADVQSQSTYVNVNSTGAGAQASGSDSVAIGPNAASLSPNWIAIGKDSRAYIDDGVAIGNGALGSNRGVAIGTDVKALLGDVAIGYRARAIASRTPGIPVTHGNIAIGAAEMTGEGADQTGPVATEGYAIAIGTATQANGVAAIAIDQKAVASKDRGVAIGMNAQALNADDVALGGNSVTDVPHATRSVTIGDTSYDFAGRRPTGVLSVGAPGRERQITNVAAGRIDANSTDAVNGSQLHATNQVVSANTTSITDLSARVNKSTNLVVQANGSWDGDIMIGPMTGGVVVSVGGRQIKGVADGADASDAATVGQLDKVSTAVAAVSTVASHGVQYDDEQHAHVTLGGASATAPVGLSNVAAGVVSETSTEAVNGSQLHATNRTVSANTASITDLSSGIAKGTLGLVQQAKGQPDGAITIGAATGGSTVNVAGTSGARQIKGVADGVDASDAATVGQLGKIRTAVSTLTDNVIQYDNATRSSVTLGGLGATVPVRVSNVAPANLSETSTDAVNGAQLFALSQTVTTHTQAIDALSGMSRSVQASIANLTPSVTLPTQFLYVAVQSDRAAAKADGVESVAMGGQAQARGAYSVAVGSGAQATGEGATALGAQTSAQGKDAVALGRDSLAPDENTVSIGNRETGLTRTLTNVSAGVGSTDAVNVRQLNDAVGGLRSQIEHDRRDASGGTASAVAIASLPQAPAPGQRIVSIGGGTYGGQSAMAVGVSTYAGRWIVKAAGSTNTRGTVAASVGAGYVW